MDFSIFNMAKEHNELIAYVMIAFAIVFFLIFFLSLSKKNAIYASILKFAPSIMTALGLFGTFVGLTLALSELDISNTETVTKFVSELKPVFSFSILGIGSSIFFMILNFCISALNNYRIQDRKLKNQENIEDRQEIIDEYNNKTITYLSQHSHFLNQAVNEIKNQNSLFIKNERSVAQLLEIIATDNRKQTNLLDNQAAAFGALHTSISQMTGAIANMETGYDMDKLGDVIAVKMSDLLLEPLNNIKTALENNNSDTIRTLLQDLKTEVLTPIKDEIQRTTTSTNRVVSAVQESQQTNKQLIAKLGEVTGQMTRFVTQTDTLVQAMKTSVDDMKKMQENQATTLNQFNTDLQTNLDKIQPAIKDGMQTATTSMTQAIEKTTDKMNDAMKGVITDISDNVVGELSRILTDFNDNMDTHLNRMNTELEETGDRASGLIDRSTEALKTTMGEIDSTLRNLSTELQKELNAFRDEYNTSLTDFFDKQNEQLEKTLGVQSKALQDTADQLKGQFEKMETAQKDLNNQMNDLIEKANSIYNPLLNQMTTIATNLNGGNQQIIRELRQTAEYNEKINNALKELGETMPQEFAKAFGSLNDAYVKKFTEGNEALHKTMQEMITSAAALLTVANSKHHHE
ncbi:hypothetical protein LP090_04690 [Moraxella bovis]|uniref:MotA/TolQ/ExbB proton channel family protein n=1 Tax=Moraxella bovis TaxID=476 RepID=UPI002226FB69|nr:hypothetical protein [Moraxella bovis]UYZ67714.1 hypothetical protein LP122_07915 [Moraxella bovis]UYZ70087.1 hypothetical protein LP089_08000 [Moraxella bovis]UYZ74001.1 hypothetical protein LP105_04710 [Moraxella bovis]UZA13378.1 hypothetical protein LP102_08015 [Moraxella bovis]UZA28268.1 hypothetical protein LP119_04760 [Moraxella bovis]